MKMFYDVENINISDSELIEKMKVAALCEYDRYLRDYGLGRIEETLWWDDGSAFMTWFKGNIREFFASNPGLGKHPEVQPDPLKKLRRGTHKVNNTVVWLNGDKAVGETMCVLWFRYKIDGDWFDGQTWGRMHYRAEKRNGVWKLLHFTGIYEWDRMDPVFQDCEVIIPRETLLAYRDNNMNMAYRQEKNNGELKNYEEWPGPDRPETIQKLYEETSEWFYC